MGFETIRPLFSGGINSNIQITPFRFAPTFKANDIASDRAEFNSTGKYTSEKYIISQIKSNPEISKIMKEMNAPIVLNMDELRALQSGHATETKKIAMAIAKNLPQSLKNQVNLKSLQDAAYLHDLGKVLIPKEVLNKPGKLTPDEEKIMHKHSLLSYELLKNSDIDTRTLNLIKHHHQNPNHTGYPKVNDDFHADINLQILTLADKYSALLEKRAYKEPMTSKQALTIIYKDVKDGNIHPFVFNALVNAENKAVNKNPMLANS
ncbi:HD domain-containing protein [bacterium]|nr:HD domain-containing protein [bacterium]